jgi:hypothetical protein
VQRVIDAVAGVPVALAILPAGTANLFATNLRIPKDLEEAVKIGLNGNQRQLDVGLINREHVGVMAGTWFDALMIRDADTGGRLGGASPDGHGWPSGDRLGHPLDDRDNRPRCHVPGQLDVPEDVRTLAGIVALLPWALPASISLLFGGAIGAQLEAGRASRPVPQIAQKVIESEPDVAHQVADGDQNR